MSKRCTRYRWEEVCMEEGINMESKCQNCGKDIVDLESKFCPHCGAKIKEDSWQCSACSTLNESESNFCKNCGAARNKVVVKQPEYGDITMIAKYKYFKQVAIAVVLLIATACASYYYFTNMNEGNYLKLYSEAHNVLNEATSVVVSNTKQGAITADGADDLKKRLQSQKDEVDNEAKEFTSKKPFQGYTAQHEAVTELLQRESSILGLAIQVLNNPLDEGLDSLLEEGKDTVQQIKSLSGQISVPNTVMTLDDDITVLPQQLKAYVVEQRKLEEERKRLEAERQARLKELNDFFAEMDSAISQYNSAKSNLGGMMESSRNGGMLWSDYFKVLDQARSDRLSVKYKVNSIKAPQGTEGLKQEFMDILDNALRYCDVMRIRANLSYNHYYYDAYKKKEESDSIDREVQSSYTSFIENYNVRKEELLK